MFSLIASLFLVFSATALIGYMVVPQLYGKSIVIAKKREQKLSNKMDRLVPRSDVKKIARYFVIAPFVLAVAAYLLFPAELQLFGVSIGFIGGFIFPGMYFQQLKKRNRTKFDDQLVDALMIMSSSFRGGLSLIQAIEAVVEEMPDPINQEFGTLLGENKMGVSLEDALYHLYNRMPGPALQQMITAVLLARETGGNLPAIFSRIVNTIRERKKIQENIATLTMQGKLQGLVMSLLPIAFATIVYSSNRHFLDNMIASDLGRMMLIYACVSEIIGGIMIWKISTFKDF